jgi:hypothetical protein
MRSLLGFLVILLAALFFAYPLLSEDSGGECSALAQHVEHLTSRDGAGRLIIGHYAPAAAAPDGAALAAQQYPALPRAAACALAYWRSMLQPAPPTAVAAMETPSAPPAAAPSAPPAAAPLTPTISRDITPNGDPISPATIFETPMPSVAVRVDYPGRAQGPLRFQLLRGRTVLSSCKAETGGQSAWCAFNLDLRKGNYTIAFGAGNTMVGEFPFTVIGH